MGKAREMNRFLLPGVLFSFPLLLSAAVFQVDEIDFHFTLPPVNNGTARIMVLFGGHNWPGNKTLRTYRFDSLARKHNLILLSPSGTGITGTRSSGPAKP